MRYVVAGLLGLAVVIPTANYLSSLIVDAVLLSAAGYLMFKYVK